MFQLIAETTDCDFKEAVEHAKPKSWLKSVSAFANTKGGTLVFGVSDKDHAVVGLQDAQSEADFISQAIRSRIDPVPPFEMHIESEGAADVMTEPVASKRRNPVIADVFHRLNYMERRGSGLRKICEATAAEDAYKPEYKPLFEADEFDFLVTLWNMNQANSDRPGTQVTPQDTPQVTPQVEAVLAALAEAELSAVELMKRLGLSDRKNFRENYLRPALDSGLIMRTIPDKPNSRNQRYRRA